MCLYIDTSFGDRRFHNPAIACVFEFLNSPKPTLFKNEASTAPAATAARNPSKDGAINTDQGLGETRRSSGGIAEKSRRNRKKEKGNLERACGDTSKKWDHFPTSLTY
jgi:hypothetical protein